MKQNHKNKIDDQSILDCYNRKLTLHQTSVELNLSPVSLWRRAKRLNIFWSDLKREPAGKIPLNEILEGLHPYYQTFKIKNRLLSENIKENKCERCKITEWNSSPINMQLDHINGNSHDHRLENLRMLCPNCHSQTETFSGKNK